MANKYGPKITPAVRDCVAQSIRDAKGPLQARTIRDAVQQDHGVDLSLTSIRRMLHAEGLSYKRVYRTEIRANTVQAKQKRQIAAVLYTKQLAAGKIVINLDESTLDQTSYVRYGWGQAGRQLYAKNVFRLAKYNVIAATSSLGAVWYAVNHGNNNSLTVWHFILSLCLRLQEEDPQWRSHTVFYLDNAAYHRSNYLMAKFAQLQIPVLFSGPYSYDSAAAEKVFATIKRKNLNPSNRSFLSRQSCEQYVAWLAEAINDLSFGNVPKLFLRTLEANYRYFMFRDI